MLHRFALRLIALATPPVDRDAVVGDTFERLGEIRASTGAAASERWLWREVVRVVLASRRHRRAARVSPALVHDRRKVRVMSSLLRSWLSDTRHSIRVLARAPGHTLTASFCLGIGLAASVSVFSIVNALFYRPLPGIANRDGLVRAFLAVQQPGALPTSASTEEIGTLRGAPRIAEMLASEGDLGVTTIIDGAATRAVAAFVSGHYFRLLGTTAAQGRVLNEQDDRPTAPPVTVVSHLFWQRQLGARPDVVGQTIVISGRPVTIVGVAPEQFGGLELSELGDAAGSRLQFWLPLSAASGWPGAPDDGEPWHAMVVRLSPDRTADSVAELAVGVGGLTRGSPPSAVRAVTSPLNAGPGDVPLDIAIMLSLFLFVPLAVLAIGCANVVNLQLARATAREREISVRLSLGASRAAVVRLLVTEAGILAVLAGLIGLAATTVALKSIAAFVPLALGIDWRVLMFTSALVLGVVVLAGLAPAWLATRHAVGVSQRQTAQAGGLGHSRLRRGLVGLEVALSLTLLVVGGLFGRSLQVMYVEAPAVIHELLMADLNFTEAGFADADRDHLLHELTARLGSDHRILGVAAEGRRTVRFQAVTEGRGETGVRGRFVTPSWFQVMDVRPTAGRVISAADESRGVVVNRQFAQNLLSPPGPGPRVAVDVRSAVGQSIRVRESEADTPQVVQIVGVVPDSPRPPDVHDDPAIYFGMSASPPASLSISVRTPMPERLLPELRRTLSAIDPRLPWAELTTGEALFARGVSPIRYLVLAVGGLGTIALLLAAAGLYGVMSYAVLLRRHEIGVRMAIGARPADVMRLVLGQSLWVTANGLAAGLVLVVPLTHTVHFLFVGVSPLDPAALTLPLLALLITSLLAGALPARRAARIDPVRALRQD